MSRVFDRRDYEYATAIAVEENGKSLEGVTWQVGLGTMDERPTAWRDADHVETVGSMARVSMMIDSLVPPMTDAYLYVRPADGAERFAIKVPVTGGIDVV